MFSRSILRACLRSRPVRPLQNAARLPASNPLPRALPKPLSIRNFSQTNPHSARFPIPRGRPGTRGPWIQPNYQEEVGRAKPLLTTPQVINALASKQTRWILVLVTAGGVVFYYSNLETVEVSGRQIFNCYSESSVEAEGERAYQMILQQAQGSILPAWDGRTKMVQRVMNRLIEAGDLHHVDWTVHVIQSNEANAFVIPGGKVFVFTGILPIAKNDDGLGAILGHEIAHNLAKHTAEKMSQLILLEPVRWMLYFLDPFIGGVGLGQILGGVILDLGLMRPGSRKQESEADYIGLMMMAKSCYNPQEAVHVWERMEEYQHQQAEIPEFLSTHPSNKNRISQMQKWLGKAEEARSESDCASIAPYAEAFRPVMQKTVNFFR